MTCIICTDELRALGLGHDQHWYNTLLSERLVCTSYGTLWGPNPNMYYLGDAVRASKSQPSFSRTDQRTTDPRNQTLLKFASNLAELMQMQAV